MVVRDGLVLFCTCPRVALPGRLGGVRTHRRQALPHHSQTCRRRSLTPEARRRATRAAAGTFSSSRLLVGVRSARFSLWRGRMGWWPELQIRSRSGQIRRSLTRIYDPRFWSWPTGQVCAGDGARWPGEERGIAVCACPWCACLRGTAAAAGWPGAASARQRAGGVALRRPGAASRGCGRTRCPRGSGLAVRRSVRMAAARHGTCAAGLARGRGGGRGRGVQGWPRGRAGATGGAEAPATMGRSEPTARLGCRMAAPVTQRAELAARHWQGRRHIGAAIARSLHAAEAAGVETRHDGDSVRPSDARGEGGGVCATLQASTPWLRRATLATTTRFLPL
ncbi:hypothetical protein C2845_PM07G20560 [Panicum miliaceum]|uniref:Uncharacterized protein n=1 Tax=Panicum miliaceum TaxID=4540 RepID=A0A3L6SIV4_PANMI|nr:hypothetical protein C2845_PM07G20560 [Panicum miliaceum]